MSFARVRALVVIGVLAVAAVVFVVVALVRDTQSEAVANGCPPGSVMADVALRKPKDIKIRVYNATNRPGLAETVSTEFKNREFQTQKPRDSKKAVDAVARLRFGPKAVGSAHLIRAYFLGLPRENLQYDPKSKSDVVDVIIGSEFLQLATTTEVNQSLAAMGEPAVPPGACPAPPPKDSAK